MCYGPMSASNNQCCIVTRDLSHQTQPFYGSFSGTTLVSQRQKKSSSGLYGASGDIRGRHTDNPAGRHSIQTNQHPTWKDTTEYPVHP